ncbi:glycine cleavage system aminomethyltransferase GcvT [Ruania alba]|uniref:Aminomethyltransferase n=1 Tax=Ruania alba TaxID=648782 RepID=A0A1H5M455_9MICO|nr:glycine cleavage system aminomethyltransferase GcvT [Ruania alba]SEE83973.1 aminomethyltransferase [Ruania alba]
MTGSTSDIDAGGPGEPRETPLRAEHEALGASFTDFGGWWMPVRYSSDIGEHKAVREAAGLFDISHMGEIVVRGAGAGEFLDYALAGRLSAVTVGRAKYTMILTASGGIIDDLVLYRLAEDKFLVIANAANRETVAAELTSRADGFDATVTDDSDSYALIALQGPAAVGILDEVVASGAITEMGMPLAEVKNYAWTDATFTPGEGAVDDRAETDHKVTPGEEGAGAGVTPLLLARTGYTGEDGFELYVAAEHAVALWRTVLAAGAPHGLIPAGLAARDTLRLEAGMPLYGHELSRDIVPAQAGLGRIIPRDKGDFVGRPALEERPDARVLVGLVAEGRRAGRAGYTVHDGETTVGEITSGALSPTLGHPVALASVDPAVAEPGTALTIDVRGKRIPATVTTPPFYRRKK